MGDSSHTGMSQLPECGLKHTEWGKAAGRRRGREGQEKVDTGRAGEKHKGFHIAIGLGGEGDDFTLLDLLKKKEKEKRKRNPNTVSN